MRATSFFVILSAADGLAERSGRGVEGPLSCRDLHERRRGFFSLLSKSLVTTREIAERYDRDLSTALPLASRTAISLKMTARFAYDNAGMKWISPSCVTN